MLNYFPLFPLNDVVYPILTKNNNQLNQNKQQMLQIQTHKYTNTQIHKYTNTQIHKYTNTNTQTHTQLIIEK